MTDKEKVMQRAGEIAPLIDNFCKKYLNDELRGYALKLLEKLTRKRSYPLKAGKIEIWASSIIHVIARFNYLFDAQHSHCITADTICDFFGTNKSTIGKRATDIEKACNIKMGEKGFCNPKISDYIDSLGILKNMYIPRTIAREIGL
jgi:hypothetical protein